MEISLFVESILDHGKILAFGELNLEKSLLVENFPDYGKIFATEKVYSLSGFYLTSCCMG